MGRVQIPRPIRWTLLALALWLVGFQLLAVLPGRADGVVFGKYATEVIQLIATGLLLERARRVAGRERLAWILLAVGVAVWTFGDTYWSAVLVDREVIPIPSPADVGYLAFLPFVFGGIVVLARARIAGVPRSLAADAVTAALAAGALSAAVVVQEVLPGAVGGALAVATNLAYPIADLVLLGVIVGVVALRGWRIDRTWAFLGAGILSFWVADSGYLILNANGSYVYPTAIDVGWPAATVLFAAAAWQPAAPRSAADPRRGGRREVALPIVFALVALGVLLVAGIARLNAVAVGLSAASLVAVMGRLAMTFAENRAMLDASRHEALTDALTGLGNRRALAAELERRLPDAGEAEPLVLVLFDLDGFKHYNDSFGHPAGDQLLARLGAALGRCLAGRGSAFRMGGDEFCALIEPGEEIAQPIVETAAASLSDHGEGFAIGCSYGSVVLPLEASDAAGALGLADQRMYAVKNGGRATAGGQSKAVLLRALAERDPYLGEHMTDVAALAESVAVSLGLPREEVEQIRHAAELHDIGKVAIPDTILHKPGPLDEREWAFILRHTLVGERIINGAPALGRVASLVRSSHERYGGGGYPDGLVGLEIPLGSRVVAICDAFDAMVTDRSYQSKMTPEEALAELRRCAGTQFDPVVVDAFCTAWERYRPSRAGAPAL